MVLAPSGTRIKPLVGEGRYGGKDGGTKLKILTKKKIYPDGRQGIEQTV